MHTYNEDLAYCAGVVDSDGSIGISKRTLLTLQGCAYCVYGEVVSVGQVEIEAINLLWTAFEGSIRKSHKPPNREFYRWCVTNKKAEACLKLLLPYLRIKKAQAENCLQFRALLEESKASVQSLGGKYGSRPRAEVFVEGMEQFYLCGRQLNGTLKVKERRASYEGALMSLH